MGTINNILNNLNLGGVGNAEDDYYDDDYDEVDELEDKPKKAGKFNKADKKFSKVTTIGKKKVANASYEINVIKPKEYGDSKEIADCLIDGMAVLLNLSTMDDAETARRVLDFAMGATYALDGTIEKITDTIFVIVPNGVDISGALSAENQN